MLLRPLPGVRDSDRLVQLYRSYPGDELRIELRSALS